MGTSINRVDLWTDQDIGRQVSCIRRLWDDVSEEILGLGLLSLFESRLWSSRSFAKKRSA